MSISRPGLLRFQPGYPFCASCPLRPPVRSALLEEVRDGSFLLEFPCPACTNAAFLKGEVDYDMCDGEAVPQGTFPVRLECPFCDLVLTNAYELDSIGAGDFMYDKTIPKGRQAKAG